MNHRDVLQWSWSAASGASASVWEEGKSTTWACSSCGWPRRDRLWKTAGYTWVLLKHGITINNCFRQLCAEPTPFSSYRTLPLSSFTLSASQVGDQIVEINGEATQGITHTRAIELIQAGGNKVHLLLRPGQGLVPDHSEWPLRAGCTDAQLLLQIYLLISSFQKCFAVDSSKSRVLCFFMLMHVLPAPVLTFLSSYSASVSIYLLCFLSALVFCISTAISTYLSFPPIGLNSSSTLCFYMKPEQH